MSDKCGITAEKEELKNKSKRSVYTRLNFALEDNKKKEGGL